MSISTLNENMDIVQNLVIPGIDTDMDIIQKLDDEPNDVGGLTAQELKEEFDKAGNIVKTYINGTLLPAISDTVAEEEQRAQAEAQRQANELARQQAEEQRANETSGIVAQATAQAQQAQQSASRAAASSSSAAQSASQASADAASAAQNASKTASDRKAIQSAIDNIPPGSVPVINNLTTGGAAAALSAEQGKLLGSLSNLTNPQQALVNLGAGVRPNLLDNWYFVGGGSQQGGGQFPINQKTQTSYTSANNVLQTIDMWKMGYNCTLSIDASGVTLTRLDDGYVPLIDQVLPAALVSYLNGKTVTLSLLTDQELITGSFVFGNNPVYGTGFTVLIYNDNIFRILSSMTPTGETTAHMIAAKLEEGEGQTLAYQDSTGAWQLLPQQDMDYGTQLAKCQQYYWESNMVFASSQNYNLSWLICNVQFPVRMRTIPAITIKSISGTNGVLSNWDNQQDSAVTANVNTTTLSNDGFNSLNTSGMTSGVVYAFKVIANAEL